MVELPYGRVPYLLDLGSRTATIVSPPRLPAPPPLAPLLAAALDAPIGRTPVEQMLRGGRRVTVIVSDATRTEPRRAFLDALRARVSGAQWTLAIATGTHGPARVEDLDLPDDLLREARVVDHDGHRDDDLVTIGVTSRGTPVRLHRCVVDTDLVIATGCIRPHYFAGFGAGVKAIFPGLGAASAIRQNHQLKTHPGARAGMIEGNPCREDLEEAVGLLATPTFLLDGVCAPDTLVHAAVAGDPITAFRAGAALARSWFTVRAPRARLVFASDVLPISGSLYQAAKIAAAVAELVEPDGALVVVAECAGGIEPVDVVNDAIFRIGVLPRLATNVSLHLVSSLSPELIGRTLLRHTSVQEVLRASGTDPIVVVPQASQLLIEVAS